MFELVNETQTLQVDASGFLLAVSAGSAALDVSVTAYVSVAHYDGEREVCGLLAAWDEDGRPLPLTAVPEDMERWLSSCREIGRYVDRAFAEWTNDRMEACCGY